jgi:hypothetical protein
MGNGRTSGYPNLGRVSQWFGEMYVMAVTPRL